MLVIGYPASGAAEIVERLLTTDSRTIACVVSSDLLPEAAEMHRSAQDAGRLRLFAGSAATPGLGLPHTAWRILDTTDEIYGVASAQEIAAGHIHDFADECPRLRDLHLVPEDRVEPPRKRSAIRRVGVLVSRVARGRRAFSRLTAGFALGAVGVALAAPFVRASGAWENLLDFDAETALSRQDVERDLRPGLRPAS